jgi:hypothetical protein
MLLRCSIAFPPDWKFKRAYDHWYNLVYVVRMQQNVVGFDIDGANDIAGSGNIGSAQRG